MFIVFSLQVFLTYQVKFIRRYFILFDTPVHGIVSLISSLDCSFLVFRNAVDGDFPGGAVVKKPPAVLALAAHILKLEQYRED